MMRFRGRRSINGVLVFLVLIFIALLVLGIVTGKIIFYILMGVEVLIIVLIIIGLFTFLKKTGQETSKTRRSTYDILEGHEIKGIQAQEEKTKSKKSKSVQGEEFCESCGMKLETGATFCSNCGKPIK